LRRAELDLVPPALCAALWLGGSGLLAGCSGGAASEGRHHAIGAVTVPASVIAALMRERAVTREQAIELAGEDALLAQGLVEQEPALGGWIQRLVLARQTLGALKEEALAGGPPTDAEVAATTEARFWELDRPRMVAVTHAVVESAGEDPAARSLAERIRAATGHATTDAEFQRAARAVDAGSFTVKVEALPPVTLDGRAVDPSKPPPAGPSVQHFDQAFSAAAQLLTRPGEQGPVMRSPFGYHVLFARSILQPQQPSLDERRALLHDEIMSQRATALSAALLERQRRELPPLQSRSALASMLSYAERSSGPGGPR
jgi:hypothetical protein